MKNSSDGLRGSWSAEKLVMYGIWFFLADDNAKPCGQEHRAHKYIYKYMWLFRVSISPYIEHFLVVTLVKAREPCVFFWELGMIVYISRLFFLSFFLQMLFVCPVMPHSFKFVALCVVTERIWQLTSVSEESRNGYKWLWSSGTVKWSSFRSSPAATILYLGIKRCTL